LIFYFEVSADVVFQLLGDNDTSLFIA